MTKKFLDEYRVYWQELPRWYRFGSWVWYKALRRPLPNIIIFRGHVVINPNTAGSKKLTVKVAK